MSLTLGISFLIWFGKHNLKHHISSSTILPLLMLSPLILHLLISLHLHQDQLREFQETFPSPRTKTQQIILLLFSFWGCALLNKIMEGMCGFRSMDDYSEKALMFSDSLMMQNDYSDQSPMFSGDYHRNISPFGSERGSGTFQSSAISESASINHFRGRRSEKVEEEKYDDEDTCGAIKAKIASHPLYPKLLHAYIDCQKVGAPPEMAGMLDEMKQENGFCRRDGAVASVCVGADHPELDEFMETYCDVLVKYKSGLERPFDEATTFFNKIEMQLGNLGKDDGGVSYTSDDDVSGGGKDNIEDEEFNVGNEEDREVKEKLLRKYGDHLSALKLEFSKKKKKGKLPKEARQTLLQWWNTHYRWPYPSEADKIYLAETTGLDQKQINNWFINQRKRHWKPSENIQLAVMGNCSQQFFTYD